MFDIGSGWQPSKQNWALLADENAMRLYLLGFIQSATYSGVFSLTKVFGLSVGRELGRGEPRECADSTLAQAGNRASKTGRYLQ